MSSHRRAKNQLTITKALIIPETKPDIERILRVTSTPEINKSSTIPGTVALTGKININVEYVACSHNNSQPIHFAEFEIPFAHFIDRRCIKRCQTANVRISVEFQEVQVINRRSINIFLILKAVILKLSPFNMIVEPHVCPMHNITNVNPGGNSMCSQLNCVEDSSVSQPCSFGTCIIECE